MHPPRIVTMPAILNPEPEYGDRQLPSSPQSVSIMKAPTIISGKIPDGTTKPRNITAFMPCSRHDTQDKFYGRQDFQLFEL